MLSGTQFPQRSVFCLSQLTERLSRVPGVAGVVLGGSYARGTQRATSDLDVGIYYHEAAPFAIEDIRQVAAGIAVPPDPVVTDFYAWGAWVNGGAWLHTAVGKVDFLYRNLDQVRRTIDDARAGHVEHDYGQQPAYGFYSVAYLAETSSCLPLYDPAGEIAALKALVAVYPRDLKARLVADSLWSAEFTLDHARDFAEGGDVYNTVGCLTRTAANLTQALFALNEVYFQSDKRVMATIAGFAQAPDSFASRVAAILAHPGATADDLLRSVAAMAEIWQDAVRLTGGSYQARFQL